MIRIAELKDLETIVDIYNQAIDARFQTGFMERQTVADEMPWFENHKPDKYPILVCELEGRLVGWLSISPYRAGRAALAKTVEISYFVDNKHIGRGIGSKLLKAGVEAARQLHYRVALAVILSRNTPSVHLVEKHGFALWGNLPEAADFDGDICDHLYYGIKL